MKAQDYKDIKISNADTVKVMANNEIWWQKAYELPEGLNKLEYPYENYSNNVLLQLNTNFYDSKIINTAKWIIHHNIEKVIKKYNCIKQINIGFISIWGNEGTFYGITMSNTDSSFSVASYNNNCVNVLANNYFKINTESKGVPRMSRPAVEILTNESYYLKSRESIAKEIVKDIEVIFYYK